MAGGPGSPAHPKRIRAWAQAPPSHPLSPHRLSRNGRPQYLVHELSIHGPTPPSPLGPGHHSQAVISKYVSEERRYRHLFFRRQKEADELVHRQLRHDLRLATQVTFDGAVVAELEELDIIAARWDGGYEEYVVQQCTIPLIAQSASYGYTKPIPQRDQVKGRQRKDRKVRRTA